MNQYFFGRKECGSGWVHPDLLNVITSKNK